MSDKAVSSDEESIYYQIRECQHDEMPEDDQPSENKDGRKTSIVDPGTTSSQNPSTVNVSVNTPPIAQPGSPSNTTPGSNIRTPPVNASPASPISILSTGSVSSISKFPHKLSFISSVNSEPLIGSVHTSDVDIQANIADTPHSDVDIQANTADTPPSDVDIQANTADTHSSDVDIQPNIADILQLSAAKTQPSNENTRPSIANVQTSTPAIQPSSGVVPTIPTNLTTVIPSQPTSRRPSVTSASDIHRNIYRPSPELSSDFLLSSPSQDPMYFSTVSRPSQDSRMSSSNIRARDKSTGSVFGFKSMFNNKFSTFERKIMLNNRYRKKFDSATSKNQAICKSKTFYDMLGLEVDLSEFSLQDEKSSSDDGWETSWISSDIPSDWDPASLNLIVGNLVFRTGLVETEPKPCMVIDTNTPMQDVAMCMTRVWRVSPPKIMLSILSSHDHFHGLGESSIEEDFQLGIIEAAKLTNMWILTDGLNAGLGEILGEAAGQEVQRREMVESYNMGNDHMPQFNFFAVANRNDLRYGVDIVNRLNLETPTLIENQGKGNLELNPDFTHYFIIDGEVAAETMSILRNLETRMTENVIKTKVGKPNEEPALEPDVNVNYHPKISIEGPDILPVTNVCILYQGGPKEIDHVAWLLKNQTPVMVIQTEGLASGLIGYAVCEGLKGGNIQHLQTVVKTQLVSMVINAFPEEFIENELARNQCRDKILSCVKNAIQDDCIYLTVMDINDKDVDINDLRKYLLKAMFLSNSSSRQGRWRDKLNWILRLALEWNTPEFVVDQFVESAERSNFKIRDGLFATALILPQRAEFVKLFLSMGFVLHKFLTPSRLQQIYEKSLDNDFFTSVCLKQILGRYTTTLEPEFVFRKEGGLNEILSCLTDIRIPFHPEKLFGTLDTITPKEQDQEKEALLGLIYWAVLNNKRNLAKVLWHMSYEPIAMALVISNMFYRLSRYWIVDIDLKIRVSEHSKEFSKLAIEIMDLTYNDSKILAFRALITPLTDFNNLTIVDLAFIGKNKYFIAHPCCQRSLTERWYSHIHVQTSRIFYIPVYIKIFLCLTLVFPMYFWLQFIPEKRKLLDSIDEKEQSKVTSELKEMFNLSAMSGSEIENNERESFQRDLFVSPSLPKKLYYLWTAPITKFWLNQFFFLIYLALYSYSLLLPYCGHPVLNDILAAWTVTMLVEDIKHWRRRKSKFWRARMLSPTFRIMMDLYMLGGLLLVCVEGHLVGHVTSVLVPFTTIKIIRCFGLIAYCYIAMASLLPVSKSLGPMLVNIEKLIRHDLVYWFSMWFFFLVAGGMAIQLIIYPLKKLDRDTLGLALLRALLGIFLTDTSDLTGTYNCTKQLDKTDLDTCDALPNTSSLLDCPNQSAHGYIFVIYYLLITRLLIYTLMFAIFSATIAKTRGKAVEIWKYQFYHLVINCEERPVVPVPLTALLYPYRLAVQFHNFLQWLRGCSPCCLPQRESGKRVDDIFYNQWKTYMDTMTRREEEEEMKKTQLTNTLAFLESELGYQKAQAKKLNHKFIQMEKNQSQIGYAIQKLLHTMDTADSKAPALKGNLDSRQIHTESRHSPYPHTDLVRFPLFDKDTPWDVKLESYDPVIYSKPAEEFPPDLQPWVDDDPLQPTPASDSTKQEEAFVARTSIGLPKYNKTVLVQASRDMRLTVDRKSYMTQQGKPVIYNLDSTELPMNPYGRTGLRGRGALAFWGPNHFIQVVLSRLAVEENPDQSNRASIAPTKIMTFLVLADKEDAGVVKLPGDLVTPDRTCYSKLCQTFLRQVLKDDVTIIPDHYGVNHLIQFFSSYSMSELSKNQKSTSYSRYGFFPNLAFRGYMDNALNTDNAWKEAEIWSFHYKYNDCLTSSISDTSHIKWIPLSTNMGLTQTEFEAVVEAGKIHGYHL